MYAGYFVFLAVDVGKFDITKGVLIGQRSDFTKRRLSLCLWLGSAQAFTFLEVLILEKLAATCNIISNIIMLHSFEHLVHQGKNLVLRRE